jgi:tetratricopeptide (TPR) repeat protein
MMKRKDMGIKDIICEKSYKKAIGEYGLEDYEFAINKCKLAISVNQEDHEAWKLMGICLYESDRYDEALRALCKVDAICPNDYDTLLHTGHVHYLAGRRKDAYNCYKRATKINPELPTAWDDLGNCLSGFRRWDEAIDAFERACNLRSKQCKVMR